MIYLRSLRLIVPNISSIRIHSLILTIIRITDAIDFKLSNSCRVGFDLNNFYSLITIKVCLCYLFRVFLTRELNITYVMLLCYSQSVTSWQQSWDSPSVSS